MNQIGEKEKMEKALERAERKYQGRYYERDARLMVLATRGFIVGLGGLLIGALALSFAFYMGRQPATVIKVTDQGEAMVLSPSGPPGPADAVRLAASDEDRTADDLERRAFIRQFLLDFENTDPDTAEKQIAQAINRMSEKLRGKTLEQLRQRNSIGHIKKKRIISKLDIRTTEQPAPEDKFHYLVIANKRLHYFEGEREIDSTMVMKYTIRLLPEPRTVFNPHGLRIYDFSQQVVTETSG